MPTYLQLAQEAWWRNQVTPPNMTTILLDPLRRFYGTAAGFIGAPGDNEHLYGRHRSVNWDLNSHYCTNRAYGTQDPRDRRGSLDWYRAFDVVIQGQALWDASRRVDQLVRAGRLPGLAEWFGTFDGRTVVGWYEGHPSGSDDSHLSHFHGGLWTESANDPATLRTLYIAITGIEGDEMGVFCRQGDTGDAVSGLQAILSMFDPTVGIDGSYGPKTTAALKAALATVGWNVDGATYWAGEYANLQAAVAAKFGGGGLPGPGGPPGIPGPPGPKGDPGQDGLGVGAAVTIAGTITAA